MHFSFTENSSFSFQAMICIFKFVLLFVNLYFTDLFDLEAMLPSKQAEEAIVSNFNEAEHDDREEEREDQSGFNFKSALWHGGSVYDAWFSCASNQVHKYQIILKTHVRNILVLSMYPPLII